MAYTKEMRDQKAKQKKELENNSGEKINIKNLNNDIKFDNKIKTRNLKKDIHLNTLVEVKNGFNGKLTYISKKNNGMEIVWESFGDVEYLELSELVSAFSAQKKFFTANWWLIDDIEILDFLGAKKFYENALTADNFNNIFKQTPNEIKEKISQMTSGQQKTLAYIAIDMINSGELDSRIVIKTLEESLGFNLIEEQ